MNHPGAGVIDAVGLAALRASLASVVTDPDASPLVTLSTPAAAPTVDYAAGTVTPSTVDDTTRGLLEVLTAREVAASGGLYQTGDWRLRLMSSDLSTAPTTDTTVTVGANRYAVLSISTGILPGTDYLLTLRPRG